jgi:hypothetical protein
MPVVPRDFSLKQERFVRLRRASNFLLSGQEKVTKEKAPLHGACRASPDKSVSRGRAFRQDIGQPLLRCFNSGVRAVAGPVEKEPTSLSAPAARPCRPQLTASQGSEDQRQQQQQQQQQQQMQLLLHLHVAEVAALCSGARKRVLLIFIPLCSGGRVEDQPAG